MKCVVGKFIEDIRAHHDKAGNAYGKAQQVDQGDGFGFQQAAIRDLEVIAEHVHGRSSFMLRSFFDGEGLEKMERIEQV